MRQAGRIVAEILNILVEHIKPGVRTKDMDIIAERELKKRGAESSFKGYVFNQIEQTIAIPKAQIYSLCIL